MLSNAVLLSHFIFHTLLMLYQKNNKNENRGIDANICCEILFSTFTTRNSEVVIYHFKAKYIAKINYY
jgi:hypothetical protein